MVSWDFWLVGVETDDALNELCNAQERPPGCAHLFKGGRARIWVRTWGEIVHDCLARHEDIRSKLELEVEEDDSVAYLEEVYMKVVKPDEATSAAKNGRGKTRTQPVSKTLRCVCHRIMVLVFCWLTIEFREIRD